MYKSTFSCDAVELNHVLEAYETSPDTDLAARLVVEMMGIEPIPLDFQSSAITLSATSPFLNKLKRKIPGFRRTQGFYNLICNFLN
jgi:hypothetical protein